MFCRMRQLGKLPNNFVQATPFYLLPLFLRLVPGVPHEMR
jgi:hypothetical protein